MRDGGRLATITSEPPDGQRSIQISSVYVRPDGRQLRQAADLFDDGRLSIEVGHVFGVDEGAAALQAAMHGGGGKAVVLRS
ncbi:MAG: zinc-binding dehydrogenase [Solirubrobacterales bacterium]|nr:zinc-binding dehydrogenase [Solirubrobacterales bacterium]